MSATGRAAPRAWTSREIRHLRVHGKVDRVDDMARRLGRSVEVVRQKLSQLGIHRRNGNGNDLDETHDTHAQLGFIIANLIEMNHTLREMVNRA